MSRKTKDEDTDPQMPTVHITAMPPTSLLKHVTPAIPAHTDIAGFSGQLERLMLHANEQAKIESDYQSRWSDWKKDLEVVWRKVKSHA